MRFNCWAMTAASVLSDFSANTTPASKDNANSTFFACQEQFVCIRSDAFDNEVICIQCCNFTDKRVKPVVALALSQQDFCSGVNGLENLRIQCRCKCFCRCIGAQAGRYRCDQDFLPFCVLSFVNCRRVLLECSWCCILTLQD